MSTAFPAYAHFFAPGLYPKQPGIIARIASRATALMLGPVYPAWRRESSAVTALADLLDRARGRPRVHDRDPAACVLCREVRRLAARGDDARLGLRRLLADLD